MAENRWINPYFSPEVHPEIPGVTSQCPHHSSGDPVVDVAALRASGHDPSRRVVWG